MKKKLLLLTACLFVTGSLYFNTAAYSCDPEKWTTLYHNGEDWDCGGPEGTCAPCIVVE